MLFRKKPVVVEASQWFKNGDHPNDAATEMFDYPSGPRPQVIREGAVVRYFRRPDKPGTSLCEHCVASIHDHGWIDTLEGGHIVCPGDWIITGVKGERYPCKPDVFAATYEFADGNQGATQSSGLNRGSAAQKENSQSVTKARGGDPR